MSVRKPLVRLALLALFALVACKDRATLKIGFVGGTSGANADVGVEGREGVLLAIAERNARGGLQGRTIELLSFNVQGDALKARAAIAEMEAAGCVGAIGPFTSEMSMAILPALRGSKLLVISPTASSPLVAGIDDQFLRSYPDSRLETRRMADYMFDHRGVRRLTILYDARNRAHGKPITDTLHEQLLKRGAESIQNLAFGGEKTTHFRATIERALEHPPDSIFVIANAHNTALFCQQLRKMDADVDVFGTEWSASKQLVAYGGSAVDGITLMNKVEPDCHTPRYLRFLDTYEERFGAAPGFGSILAYDAVRILFAGIEANGPQKAKDWILKTSEFETLQGTVVFDAYGDVDRTCFIVQLRKAHFEKIGAL